MVVLNYYYYLILMDKKIYDQVAKELNIPNEVVEYAYKQFWFYIKNSIENLPLKEDLTIEQLMELRTNFNIPSLGKLYCLPNKILKMKENYDRTYKQR